MSFCSFCFTINTHLCLQIGLDFTPWCAPTEQERDDQMNVFVKQLHVAKELDLPV